MGEIPLSEIQTGFQPPGRETLVWSLHWASQDLPYPQGIPCSFSHCTALHFHSGAENSEETLMHSLHQRLRTSPICLRQLLTFSAWILAPSRLEDWPKELLAEGVQLPSMHRRDPLWQDTGKEPESSGNLHKSSVHRREVLCQDAEIFRILA